MALAEAPRSIRGCPLLQAIILSFSFGTAAISSANCWSNGFRYSNCCLPPNPACFNEVFTFELCCAEAPPAIPYAGVEPLEFSEPQLLPFGALKEQDVKVDIVVRTYWKAAEMLFLLVRSIEIYWPRDAGKVFIVLDDSEQDAAVCKLLPTWVTCLLEPDSEVLPRFSNVSRALYTSLPGMLSKELALLEIDKYSTADFIAVLDADTVFITYGLPELFFSRREGRVVPWQYGRSSGGPFRQTVSQLGLEPWVAEFMDSFPQVFHHRHFAACREYIAKRFGGSFREAFATLAARVGDITDQAEFPSFHTVLGAFAYRYHHQDYAWALQYGWLSGVPWEQTCPGLRAVAHVSYAGRTYVARPGEPLVEVENPETELFQPRLGPATHWPAPELGAALYSTRAWRLLLTGACAVRWQSSKVTAEALPSIRAEACGHHNLTKLMLSNGYMREWKLEQATYCGARRPDRLWAEYKKALAGITFEL